MIKLTVAQVCLIHGDLIAASGGLDGLRDSGLLDSALQAPFQTFDGQALYPSVQQKAAQLGFALIANHPFVDGNKRIGIHAMLVFLALNGIDLDYTQEELIALGLGLASGDVDAVSLLRWILHH